MPNAAYTDTVQKVYIAYYGRAADPAGLAYWEDQLAANGGDLASIMNLFGTSTEATALFGNLTNTIKVNTLYSQIFGRDADEVGLKYYSTQLSAGNMTGISIAQNILDGATGSDSNIITNKLAVAKAFTAAIDSDEKLYAYAGDAAASSARDMLAKVNALTNIELFDLSATVNTLVSMAADALASSLAIAEPIKTAAFDAASIDYYNAVDTFNIAAETAAASKLAAQTAAKTVADVELSTASQTAAALAVKDAIAASAAALNAANAASKLAATSSATSSVVDDLIAAKAITQTAISTAGVTTAASNVAAIKITAEAALEAALEIAESIKTAAFDAAYVNYNTADAIFNAAFASAFASKAATKTAADAYAGAQTLIVTASGGNYIISSQANKYLTFKSGFTYTFDLSDKSLGAHPLGISKVFDGTLGNYGSKYSTGVTVTGTPGELGASLAVEVTASTPAKLYYYCPNHTGMGALIGVSQYNSKDVALSKAFQSAAVIAVADAAAVTAAALATAITAEILVTSAAATLTFADDEIASKALSETSGVTTSAATAAFSAARMKTNADAANASSKVGANSSNSSISYYSNVITDVSQSELITTQSDLDNGSESLIVSHQSNDFSVTIGLSMLMAHDRLFIPEAKESNASIGTNALELVGSQNTEVPISYDI